MSNSNQLQCYMCPKCSWSDFYETQTCPRCQTKTETVTSSGRGRIATFTVVRYTPQGFEKEAPYAVAIIDLEGGPRVLGRVTANPDEIQTAKTVRFVERVGGALRFEF